jgi:thiamine biosynthesis lipoprotein
MNIAALLREPFRAMGTECVVCITARPGDIGQARAALAAAKVEIRACEGVLSRFEPGSDLSRLNSVSGDWLTVDVRLVEALGEAVRARIETEGKYDPTILPVLAAAGYDRSFEKLLDRPPAALSDWRAGGRIDVDPENGCARLEAGVGVDLGGIGKGFAASRALAVIRREWPGVPGALIDLGGDIAVLGSPPEGGPWRIAIADPRIPEGVAGTLAVTNCAVATSGRDVRRFGHGLHHLIDPTTGSVAHVGPLAVTVVASLPVEAEAHATALAISDLAEASGYLSDRPQLSALLVPNDGEAIAIGELPFIERRQLAEVTI